MKVLSIFLITKKTNILLDTVFPQIAPHGELFFDRPPAWGVNGGWGVIRRNTVCQKTKTLLKCTGRAKTDKDADDQNVNVVVTKKQSCILSPVTNKSKRIRFELIF
jgi:hypothetical protein